MAVVITADAQDSWPPRVLVSVTGLTVGDSVILYRSVGGERTEVRAGAADDIADTSFLRVDAELPFGMPVTYVVVVDGVTEYSVGPTTYALPGGKVAVSDAIVGLAAEVVILAWPDKDRNRRSTTFQVGGRNIVVGGRLGQPESDIELFVEASSALDNLMEVLEQATQGVVQIRQPGGYDGIDSYLAVIGVNERRFSQDGSDPRRVIALRVAETDSWAPALEARGFTLQDIADRYDLPGPILNANPYFETDASPWTSVGGTVGRSTAQAHQGVASLALTPSGSAALVDARAENVPATAGVTYSAAAWVRCVATRLASININWRNGGSTLISTSTSTTALTANTWTLLEIEATAPALTAQAQLVLSMGSTPAAGHLLYIDEAILRAAVLDLADLADDYPTLLDLAQGDFS